MIRMIAPLMRDYKRDEKANKWVVGKTLAKNTKRKHRKNGVDIRK